MRKLSFTLGLLLCITFVYGQSPHGKSFETDCSLCHKTTGWKVDIKSLSFNHDSTNYKLIGQHKTVNCRSCHKSLEFSTAKNECIDCHDDLHETTLGPDCSKCHTPKSWIVENISEIHRQGRFPLTGAHQITDCKACHKSASMRRFEPLGVECIDCHRNTYLATTKPNHQQAGYSTDCVQCHSAGSRGWDATNIEHSFFPLTAGHAINCKLCHTTGNYAKLPVECVSCHQKDYNAAATINHQQLNFSTACLDCHTTASGWKPAKFTEHDPRFFPIYSGRHSDVWNDCTECHKQTDNYAVFTCIDCHEHAKSKMDDEHKDEGGYEYNSIACFTCHPRGDTEGAFNHAATNFPLTGAHKGGTCISCHTKGFAGTGTDCKSCHKDKFDQALEPVHTTAGISDQCEPCHNTTAWKPSSFTHVSTGYELVGGHSRVTQCADCHKGATNTAKTDCISCHEVQYDTAKDHKSKAFPVDCKVCHTNNNWQEIVFDHALTKFPLTGSHIGPDCAKCHSTGYVGTSTECSSCHTPAFTASVNPSHVAAGIPKACETCHSTTAWKPSSFNHTTTGFTLTGGHLRVSQCSDCHKGTVLNTKTECIACHQVQYDGAKDHKAQSFPTDCKMCHNSNDWLNASFNHSLTGFPLTGAHTTALCVKCHASGYSGTPTDCNACHTASFTASVNPSHVAAGIPKACETCHSTTAWKPSSFNHTTTGFTLTGGHLRVSQCSDCHKGTVLNTKTECIACHQVQYDGAKDHKAQSFPTDCKMCHNSNDWLNASFNHSLTGFPLTGAHTTTLCAKCHISGYSGTPTECSSCHTPAFTASVNPSHVAAGIPKACETCHSTTAWKPSSFNHTTTGFTLTGGHLRVSQCSDCHKGTVLNTKTECIACHQVQYDGAKDHKAQSFPTDCKMCHNSNDWLNASFNHSLTGFPLTGAHTTALCVKCHASGYSGTPTDCNACHTASFTASVNPSHVAAGIPKACETCHNSTAWKPSSFNHTTTGFTLTGGHLVIAQCSDCHKGTLLSARPECISCHQVQYDGAKDHKAQAYPTDCKMCHNSNNWLNASFNHSTTSFPLTGVHTATLCSKCHINGFSGTPTDCNSCHASAFTATVNPSHTAAGITNVCEPCHNATAWKPSTFNHTTTGFSLTGGHLAIAQCSACHKGTLLTARPECISCHQVQYDNAKDHKAQVYPTDCKMCHNSNNWLNASFNHSTTSFPLAGAHITVACAKCHVNGYNNTPTNCYACHSAKYNATTNPNHLTAQFPKECESCHTVTAWTPSTFNHDSQYFPIYSGKHQGKWTLCSECHTTPTNYGVFSCTNCHEHNKTDMDQEHLGKVPNYVYNSVNCLACHPRGNS